MDSLQTHYRFSFRSPEEVEKSITVFSIWQLLISTIKLLFKFFPPAFEIASEAPPLIVESTYSKAGIFSSWKPQVVKEAFCRWILSFFPFPSLWLGLPFKLTVVLFFFFVFAWSLHYVFDSDLIWQVVPFAYPLLPHACNWCSFLQNFLLHETCSPYEYSRSCSQLSIYTCK